MKYDKEKHYIRTYSHAPSHTHKHTDLAVVVVFEPALEVCGIPPWIQAALLQNLQLHRCIVGCGNDIMERVFQGHRVSMSSLMLKRKKCIF